MTTRPTELATVPLRMALWNRRHEGSEIFEGLIHHSEATPVLLTRVYAACAALWWNSNSYCSGIL